MPTYVMLANWTEQGMRSIGDSPRRVDTAKKTLEDAGFKVGTTRTGSSDRFDDEVIIKQEPAENAPAVPGSAVDLVVND